MLLRVCIGRFMSFGLFFVVQNDFMLCQQLRVFSFYIYSIDGDVILKFQDVFSLLLYYIYNLISI